VISEIVLSLHGIVTDGRVITVKNLEGFVLTCKERYNCLFLRNSQYTSNRSAIRL